MVPKNNGYLLTQVLKPFEILARWDLWKFAAFSFYAVN